jgi:hypothetical protein
MNEEQDQSREREGFFREFAKEDPTYVNSTGVIGGVVAVILAALAIPVTILGMFAVYHHVWVLKKGLDNSVTSLILGLAGGGGVGCGLGYGVARFGRGGPPGIPTGWHPPSLPRKE